METKFFHFAYFRAAITATDLAACEDIVAGLPAASTDMQTPATQLFSLLKKVRPDFSPDFSAVDTVKPLRLDVLLAQQQMEDSPQVYLELRPCRRPDHMRKPAGFWLSAYGEAPNHVYATTAEVLPPDASTSDPRAAVLRRGCGIAERVSSPRALFGYQDAFTVDLYSTGSGWNAPSPVWAGTELELSLWDRGIPSEAFFSSTWDIPGTDLTAAIASAGTTTARWSHFTAHSDSWLIRAI